MKYLSQYRLKVYLAGRASNDINIKQPMKILKMWNNVLCINIHLPSVNHGLTVK